MPNFRGNEARVLFRASPLHTSTKRAADEPAPTCDSLSSIDELNQSMSNASLTLRSLVTSLKGFIKSTWMGSSLARFIDRRRVNSKLNGPLWRKIALDEIARRADPRALADISETELRVRRTPSRSGYQIQNKWIAAPKAALSVLLGTYNRLDALKLAIQSVRDNGFDEPYEIIVVDGGSTDGSIEWLTQQHDIILILQHNRDGTRNNARRRSWGYFINLGFKIAESPWILMISDDCLLLPGSMKNSLRQARALEAGGKDIGGVAYYFRNWPMEERYYVQHTIGGMMMVNHGLFSKRALIDVGNANEDDFSFYKADSDLSLKLWHQGYEIVDCKDAVVEHLLLPSEALRANNTQSMDDDRDTLFERWRGIYTHVNIPGLFKTQDRRYLNLEDHTSTAEKFRPLLEKEEIQ